MITKGKVNWLILLSGIFILLLTGCSDNTSSLQPKSSLSITPPHFEDLQFPEDGLEIRGDTVWEITGRLVDNSGLGFDPDRPVVIWFDTIIDTEVIRSVYVYLSEPYYDGTWFDQSTGEFCLPLGEHRKFIAGTYGIRMIGYDATGAETDPVESVITVHPIPGTEMNIVRSARRIHGEKVIDLLEAYVDCLHVYGELYEYECRVIERFIQFFDEIYIQDPVMSVWSGYAESLMSDLASIEQPGNPLIRVGVEGVAAELNRRLDDSVSNAARPFFNSTMDPVDAIEEHRRYCTGDVYTIDFETPPQPANGLACDISLYTDNWVTGEGIMDVGNFRITADPEEDLLITGYIGSEYRRYIIASDDYENPLQIFNVINDALLVPHLFKY